jgi:hypothetical protein
MRGDGKFVKFHGLQVWHGVSPVQYRNQGCRPMEATTLWSLRVNYFAQSEAVNLRVL